MLVSPYTSISNLVTDAVPFLPVPAQGPAGPSSRVAPWRRLRPGAPLCDRALMPRRRVSEPLAVWETSPHRATVAAAARCLRPRGQTDGDTGDPRATRAATVRAVPTKAFALWVADTGVIACDPSARLVRG